MRRHHRLAIIFLIILLCGPAAADLYQWTDEKGVVHITDSPPRKGKPGRRVETIHRRDPQKPAATAPAGAVDWNSYEQGLKLAKATGQAAIVVFHATWCPTCRRYLETFDQSAVIDQSRRFVMIRVDVDRQPEISSWYELDGKYVPRTFALRPDGEIIGAAYPPKAKHRYYFGTREADLLDFMKRAADAFEGTPGSQKTTR